MIVCYIKAVPATSFGIELKFCKLYRHMLFINIMNARDIILSFDSLEILLCPSGQPWESIMSKNLHFEWTIF